MQGWKWPSKDAGANRYPAFWLRMWGTDCLRLSCYMKRKETSNLSYIMSESLCYFDLACVLTNGTMQKILTAVKIQHQFSSVTPTCPALCDPMNLSMPGLPVHHQLLEFKFTQTHVHRVSDAIQSSHLLSSPSPPAPNPSQHQGLFQ